MYKQNFYLLVCKNLTAMQIFTFVQIIANYLVERAVFYSVILPVSDL